MLDMSKSGEGSEGRSSASVQRRKSIWRWPALWWPFVVGLAFLSVAIALEHGAWVVGSSGGHAAGTAGAGAHPSSSIFRMDSLVLLISEVGYAFIIAWVVSYFIEAGARREQNEAFDQSMSAISQDVFQGVFRIRHRPEYVQAVITNCLETRLVREGYDLTYTVDPFTPAQEAKHDLDPGRFVQVTAAIRYHARNIGTKTENFTTSYGIPTRSGKLRPLSGMTGLRIGGKPFNQKAIEALRVTETKGSHPTDIMYRFDFTLDPQQSIEVVIEVVLVKEKSDAETFGFGLPTMDASIRLNMNVPSMRFGATPRIIGELREVRSPENGRSGEWKVDHPILPYNSVILWWRSPEDDGTDDVMETPESEAGIEQVEPAGLSDQKGLIKRAIHASERIAHLVLPGKNRSDKS
ncbi:MAG TPA: hypothetical protein VFQ67_01810 [Allosphingosinicella sp.]|jgi:hypothetical protein|nr:hypothetical protein [Allosphingosinicella sp.]